MTGVVDYDAGNLRSVETALDHLGSAYRVSASTEELKNCERLIFPGVGHALSAMQKLKERGLDDFLREFAASGKPVLGICLGSQILLEKSEEGPSQCLGLLEGEVRLFPGDLGLKVPHMGWNTVAFHAHPVFDGLDPESSFYFVHSFYNDPKRESDVLGTTQYGVSFASALGRKNVVAVQFHPEKSGRPGLHLLRNFLGWRP